MDIEKLKQKILDLAIRGKLVPQDPNDEPASVLIEKIKAERAKLVKEGKIKKPKEESYIYKSSDNSYYENMPKEWLYLSLKDVASITMGQSPNGSDIIVEKVLSSKEFHQGKLAFGEYLLGSSNKYAINYNKVAVKGSLLFCVRAPVGEINYTDREIAIGRGLCAIKGFDSIVLTKFLYYVLLWLKPYFIGKGTGSTFNAITVDILKDCIIPIPSLAVQNKIVQVLDKSFSHLFQIQAGENSIMRLINLLKAKMLDFYFNENSSYKSYYLKDLCKLTKSEEIFGEYPYLEAKVIRGTKDPILKKEGNFVSKNTPLILVDGENSGEIMFAPFDGYMGSTFRIVELIKEDVLIEYLYYFMLSKRLMLKENKKGSAIPHLNKKIFNLLLLPVPSKETQKEICLQIKCSFALLDKITS